MSEYFSPKEKETKDSHRSSCSHIPTIPPQVFPSSPVSLLWREEEVRICRVPWMVTIFQ